MRLKNLFRSIICILIIAFSLQTILFPAMIAAQSIEAINANVGGRSSAADDSGNSNTFLYIAAGVILVGVIVWKVISDKKKTKTEGESKSDSTKTSMENIFQNNLSKTNSGHQRIQNNLPVELFLGWKQNFKIVRDESIFLGLKFKL